MQIDFQVYSDVREGYDGEEDEVVNFHSGSCVYGSGDFRLRRRR